MVLKKAVFLLAVPTVALNPGCAPGDNFDLSKWNLQLPVGNNGPTTIGPGQLEGCSGFQDQFFFTANGDGSLVMTVPGSPSSSGCVTTPNSQHCRTKLREISPGSWNPNNLPNRMRVTLATRSGGNEVFTPLGNMPLNDGGFQTLSIFSLGAPPSYFKVGNYNQGSSLSEMHFFSVFVTHSASSLGPPTSPSSSSSIAPLSIISLPGLGPVEAIYQLQPTCGTIKLGNLDGCKKANQPAPSASPRPSARACLAAASTSSSTRTTPLHDRGVDVRLTAVAAQLQQNPAQPSIASDSTVTLRLFSADDCCSGLVETIKIGNLNVCDNANAQFSALTQSVGTNLFGRSLRVFAYASSDCSDTSFSVVELSDNDVCIFGATWKSFKLAPSGGSSSPPPPSSPSCGAQPQNSDPGAMTLDLWSDHGCCGPIVETITVHTLNVCHNTGSKFNSITQAVGKNLFGHNFHVYAYSGTGCSANQAS
ncbi:hypothetical protein VTK73DRAFT_2146 [Phialemonium thermophilum]|uniref:Alginate lyase 2 domain-containing protein n=1 Tax=Phialemonium thermophilum TaxID=223376 RepID=A0ABR3VSH8_9PEZI